MKYRKQPIEVDAVQWTGANLPELAAFTARQFQAVEPPKDSDGSEMTARVFDRLHDTWVLLRTGDWVVRGIRGEFYPVESEVFRSTYEPVADPVEKLLGMLEEYDTPERAAAHAVQQDILDRLHAVLPGAHRSDRPLPPANETLEDAMAREKDHLRALLGFTDEDLDASVDPAKTDELEVYTYWPLPTPGRPRDDTDLCDIAGYEIGVGDDSFSVRCPTCEDGIYENPGDQYVKNFGMGRLVSLGEVAAAIAKHEREVHR